jgi:hypothetical protein
MASGRRKAKRMDVPEGFLPLPLSSPFLEYIGPADFLGRAKLGDWVEGRFEFGESGRSLSFVNCYLSVGGEPILPARGVFKSAKLDG